METLYVSKLIPERVVMVLTRRRPVISTSSMLSLGQTDWQVVASRRKLNLGKDLRWVAKRLASFFVSIRKSQKKTFKGRLSCISLANNRLMDVTQLALTWVGWPNGEKLAVTCVEI